MCGIFGIISTQNSKINQDLRKKILQKLFILSESRGKESAGIAIKNVNLKKIGVLKKNMPASDLLKTTNFKEFYQTYVPNSENFQGAIIAHSRLVTNGTALNNNNNQPIIKNGGVLIHNGICTNVQDLWNRNKNLTKLTDLDSEILASLLRREITDEKKPIGTILKEVMHDIEGTASIAMLQKDYDNVLLFTNNGSLYYSINEASNTVIFASENYILQRVIDDLKLPLSLGLSNSHWMTPNTGLLIHLETENVIHIDITEKLNGVYRIFAKESEDIIVNHSPGEELQPQQFNRNDLKPLEALLEYNSDSINKLKRCSKCILPETFPFIAFDEEGVCNYCNHYVPKYQTNRVAELKELVQPYRSRNGKPDCIIPFSGGRDSSYGLHYMVKELKLKPLTYTYDWGMVTDLARRNIARLCGELGIENILVSANIKEKRRNIKLNFSAWLKNPQLGVVPLFMAGDKHFIYYINRLKKQTGLELNIWSTNKRAYPEFCV